MLLLLFILVPFLAGALAFFLPTQLAVKSVAFAASLATLALVLYAISLPHSHEMVSYSTSWIGALNSRFSLNLDGAGKITSLLTAVSFPIIFLATWKNTYKNANQFYGLMLLTMAGLMGVFLATDCLLFYFFWELALVPAYFLCSTWGGERRIPVSFKFFIYTFVGSLMMLIGIIYLYNKTPDQSFAWSSFTKAVLTPKEQAFFLLVFLCGFCY